MSNTLILIKILINIKNILNKLLHAYLYTSLNTMNLLLLKSDMLTASIQF